MRFIRPAANKQNREPLSQTGGDRPQLQKLRQELKAAYGQINQLKQANSRLGTQLQSAQKQIVNLREMKEELQFLREQEVNCKQQLDNYVVINRKLREELERNEKQKRQMATQINQLKGQLPSSRGMEVRQTTCRQNSSEKVTGGMGRCSTSGWQQSLRLGSSSCISSSSERCKDNHVTTPKSKLRINLQELMVENLPQRRRVFL